MSDTVYVVGTLDTKAAELAFAKQRLERDDTSARVVDISTGKATDGADVAVQTVAEHHPSGPAFLEGDDRGAAVAEMGRALTAFLTSREDLGAVLGIGGSGGTAMIAPAMQALPLGTPRVLVPTVASGDVSPYVGPTDIFMLYSVTETWRG